MNIQTIITEPVTSGTESLTSLLDKYIKEFEEGSILAITSKIVAIIEGSARSTDSCEKNDLIAEEADYYLPPEQSKYGIVITIKDNVLIPSAGIDESNANGSYILWPKNAQETANQVRKYLVDRFKVKKVGVIITDSKTTPLRWGTSGIALAHSGFKALNDYIGQPDIFNKPLRVTKANIMDGLASSAVLMMGEGNEQTPLAVIQDIPFVTFTDADPTQEELNELSISLEDDLYEPLLTGVQWQKGKKHG